MYRVSTFWSGIIQLAIDWGRERGIHISYAPGGWNDNIRDFDWSEVDLCFDNAEEEVRFGPAFVRYVEGKLDEHDRERWEDYDP